jgi:membrane associated rhomboid family serine protease
MGQAYYRSGGSLFQESKATLYIIVATVAVFFLQMFMPDLTMQWLSLIPERVLFRVEIWRLVSYMFVHGGFSHIFFNMLGLFFFGPVLEKTIGYRRFLILYFLCGVGAGIVATFFYYGIGQSDAHVIGASGAIFGVITAYAVLFPNSTIYLYFVLPIKAKWMVVIYGALEFATTFQQAGGGKGGIASIAHLTGIVIAYFYISGGHGLRKLWYRYKYWQGERELKKFKVYQGDKDKPTYH